MLISTFVVASLFVIASTGSVLAETTLTVWFSEYQKNCIDPALEGFYELYPDIKVEYGPLAGGAEQFQNMVLALSAGEGIPDVAVNPGPDGCMIVVSPAPSSVRLLSMATCSS